jgi:hypothetical protein
LSDADINIRLRAIKGDTSALDATKREVQAIEQECEKAAEASRKIVDTSGPAPWSGANLPTSKPGRGVDLGHEGALAESLAAADKVVPVALSSRQQAKELIDNTQLFKHELRDLLNLPGERTRDEVERITTAIDILRANAGEARGMAATLAETGESALASRLYTVAAAAEKAAMVQSTVRASRAAVGGVAKEAAEREVAGITAMEAATLSAGLRQAGASGGFFSSTMAMGVEKLGLMRMAMWGVAGLAGGALVGALAAVVGWIAKGAAATPQFQQAMQGLHGSTSQLGSELNRTSGPFKDFLGHMSSDVVKWFSARVQEASDGLSVINARLGIPEADTGKRRLEDMGKAAQSLATDLDAAGAAADRLDQRLSQSIAKMEGARAARSEQLAAEEKYKLAQVDLAEQQGNYTPEQANAERQRIRVGAQQDRSTTDGTFYQAERDSALDTLNTQTAALADAQAKRERLRSNLQEATTLAGDHPTDDQKKQLDQMRAELTTAAQAVEEIDAKVKSAKAQAEAASARLQANIAETQTQAIQQQAEEAKAKAEQAKAERTEQAKTLREQLDGLAAAHELRMAGIAASGAKEEEIARQRLEEVKRYEAERLGIEDKIGALQDESDAEHQARVDRANAAILGAQQQADAAKARADKLGSKDAEKDWAAAVPQGRIDARTQNVMGAMGETLAHHGQLEPGATRSAMGTIEGPSRLGGLTGEPKKESLGGLKPAAEKPHDKAGDEAAKATQETAKAVHDLVAKITGPLAEIKREAQQAGAQLPPTMAAITSELQKMGQTLKQTQAQVKGIYSR